MPDRYYFPRMKAVLGVSLVVLLVCQEVSAWGPRGRKAVTLAAMQVVRQEYKDAFRAERSDYLSDVLRGAEEGVAALGDSVPLRNDTQALAAVFHEIQLLRETRRYGPGSYFAYRMGVLSALAAQLVVPFGIIYTDADIALKARVDADLDKSVDRFTFRPEKRGMIYVRSTPEYFATKRIFYPDDRKLIYDDYERGAGDKGFLHEAGQTYFDRAFEAVADCWNSVLREQGGHLDIVPSPRIVTAYFVGEVGYLLNEKGNIRQADRAYRIFRRVNPDLMEPYETIGDMYYAFETEESRARGVKEWLIAYGRPGPQRKRTSKKLSAHFIETGDRFTQRSQRPGADDSDLKSALFAYQNALEFDRANEYAAARINRTAVAIKEREEQFEDQLAFIGGALSAIKEAERSGLQEDYGNAIIAYNRATGVLGGVDNMFDTLDKQARKTRDEIKKAVKKIYDDVLNKAETFLEDGDVAVDEKRFEDALSSYAMVKTAVDAIPSEEGTSMFARKQGVIDRASVATNTAKAKQQQAQEEREAVALPVKAL